MQNYISINIIYIRSRSGLSQEDIGNIIGTSYHAVSSYEKKKSLPPIDKIQLFCKEFNLSIDDFVNKDLSTLQATNSNVVNEPVSEYILSDKETELYNKMLLIKDDVIYSKEGQIKVLQDNSMILTKSMTLLEKTVVLYETLLNQNGIL